MTVVPELPAGTAIGDAAVAVTIRREAALLAAAQQVGLGQAALDLAVAYAGERHQFGRPIGSFQALKHLLADAAVGIEVARAAVHAAAVTLDEDGDVAGRHSVEAARLVASEAARRATTTCIQVHGGIGIHVGARRPSVPEARARPRPAARHARARPRGPDRPPLTRYGGCS